MFLSKTLVNCCLFFTIALAPIKATCQLLQDQVYAVDSIRALQKFQSTLVKKNKGSALGKYRRVALADQKALNLVTASSLLVQFAGIPQNGFFSQMMIILFIATHLINQKMATSFYLENMQLKQILPNSVVF
jgi:hypothetical protein